MLEKFRIHANRLTGRIAYLPVLVLMPHSRCNCRCVMCDIWRANKYSQELDAEVIERHLAAFRKLGVRSVVLSGGEALMHTDIRTLCQVLEPLDARMTLLSTGLLLKRDAALVTEYFDEVIVSLDGSSAVHDKIRNIPRAFEKLESGVRALRDLQPDFPVGARCVVQQDNHDDIAGVIEAAKLLQLSWVSFLGVDVSSSAFNRAEGWRSDQKSRVMLTEEQCDKLETDLRSCFETYREDFESKFVVESPEKLLGIVTYFRALIGLAEFPPQRCNAPWVSAVLEPDGLLRPCYFHPAYGSIEGDSILDLLNSPAAREFRNNLNVNKNPTCRRCVCTLNL